MRILVCNIGWMSDYQGEKDIWSKATYVQENKSGHEMCNFLPVGDKVFGYVQPPHDSINIERLGGRKNDQQAAGVLVIWTAPDPEVSARKVVGWYKDATVHRKRQQRKWLSEEHKKLGIDSYFMEADLKNAKLLNPDERTLKVPMAKSGATGGMGNQSATWFVGEANKGKEVHAFLEQIEKLTGVDGLTRDKKSGEPFHARNRILYGPPGTGKTWSTVRHALAIIDGDKIEAAEHDNLRFQALLRSPENPGGQVAMVTFHQNFSYEDFVEGIRPKLDDENLRYELRDGIFKRIANAARERPDKRFVLIIDEINRGNIAKIFGELITLIEDSRRIGQDDETKVTLPYSGEEFAVPDNLYIIGTMNTADRSIQLLDTALRRRFIFIEMMPNPDHELIPEDIKGVDCRRMLKVMNRRITTLLDREHQIGHTYLLELDGMNALAETFRNRIFPLLQEYFFDDWAKIRVVLGNNSFVQERDIDPYVAKRETEHADSKVYQRLPDSNSKWLDPSEYRKIYETSAETSDPDTTAES